MTLVLVIVALWAVSTALTWFIVQRRVTAARPPGPAPKTWDELRRRVLDDDYLSVADMQMRRRLAGQMKHARWLVLVLAIGTLPIFIDRGGTPLWVPIAVVVLAVYGGMTAYRLGVRWEQRWDELIAAKQNQ